MSAANDAAAVVAVSRRGAVLGGRIRDALGGGAALYVERRFADDVEGAIAFDLPLRPLIARLFGERRRLVVALPVGAVVRLIAPYVGDKRTDPAVVCVDEAGRFAVSALSGHMGGGDALAALVADAIGATAVITSASYALGTIAVDMLGREFGWRVEAGSGALTRAAAAVVNGEPVGVYQDAGELNWRDSGKPLPSNVHICETVEGLAGFGTALLITDRTDGLGRMGAGLPATVAIYRPRTLAVGVGCRRGADAAEVEALLRDTFAAAGLSTASIRCIATAEIKRDEAAIRALGERLGVPVRFYGGDALNGMPGPSGASASQRLLGIVGVAEPAALLASDGGEIVVRKVKSAAATVAVARIRMG